MSSRFLLISQSNAVVGTVVSTCGVVFLLVLGALFHAEVEELVEGKNAPSDPIAVSKACYAAAFIYLGLGVFCLIQAYMHSKEQQRLQRFSGI